MEISEQIKTLRKKKGLTQEELANRINISRSVIAKYEAGFATPTEENLKLLSEELGFKIISASKESVKIQTENLKYFLLYFSLVFSLVGIASFFLPIFVYYTKEIVNGEIVSKIPEYRSMLYISITNQLIVPWVMFVFSTALLVICILKLFILKEKGEILVPVIAAQTAGETVLFFLSIYFIIGCSIYI